MRKIKKTKNFPPELRQTAQRKVIWKIIQETGHLDAEELFLKAKKKYPRISLSTVYRSLTAFKNNGYLQDLNYDNSHRHFEIRQADHLHFVCTKCGKIEELNTKTLSKIKEEVEQGLKARIEEINLNLTGICKKCQKRPKSRC